MHESIASNTSNNIKINGVMPQFKTQFNKVAKTYNTFFPGKKFSEDTLKLNEYSMVHPTTRTVWNELNLD